MGSEMCIRDRYHTHADDRVDGLPGGEGTFLICSFWLVDALHGIGRDAEARELFERLLGLRNDLGLMAEEYDDGQDRMAGNFPQAFSHLALLRAADALALVRAGDGAGEAGD